MAAPMPIRYGSAASTVARLPVKSPLASRTPQVSETRRRMSSLSCECRHLGGDALLLVGCVHRGDELTVAVEHQPPLHFACRRHRLAFLLGIELGREQAERLHLLCARQRAVRVRHFAL